MLRVHGVAALALLLRAILKFKNWCRTSIVKIKTGSDVTDGSRARQQVLERVSEELEAGGSVFWVFPLVDESEHFQDLGSAYQVCMPSPSHATRLLSVSAGSAGAASISRDVSLFGFRGRMHCRRVSS